MPKLRPLKNKIYTITSLFAQHFKYLFDGKTILLGGLSAAVSHVPVTTLLRTEKVKPGCDVMNSDELIC